MELEESNLNDIKLEMLNTFFDNFNDIYNDFKENKLNFDEFLFNKKRFVDSFHFCRVDFKNYGSESNTIRVLESEEEYNISYPDWFSDKTGKGGKLETVEKNINLKIRCVNDGTLKIQLKGRDFRDYRNLRIPIHVSYDKLRLNNKLVLNTNKLTWHNNMINFEQNCKNGELFDIHITFNTIFDFFPELLNLLDDFQYINETEYAHNNLKTYIENKKKLLELGDDLETDQIPKKIKDLSEENYYLNQKLNDLKNEINDLRTENGEILDSYNLLFNNLFKYYELQPKDLLKYSREIIVQILDFIDKVCKKYDLQWWLYGGTLLGAYRHNGIIPWDDDCDIAMIRPDYEKFFDLFNQEIKNNNLEYMHISRETLTNNNTFLPFIKLEYRIGRKLIGFIDIFPADYISEIDDDIETIYRFEHKKLRRELKNGKDRNVALNEAFENLNVSKDPTDKIISGVEDVIFSIVDYDTLFPLKIIKFEGRLYPCPNNTKKYVEICYGDNFMTIPKINKNHGFLPHIERWEDVNELLEENINLLREVNAKFR